MNVGLNILGKTDWENMELGGRRRLVFDAVDGKIRIRVLEQNLFFKAFFSKIHEEVGSKFSKEVFLITPEELSSLSGTCSKIIAALRTRQLLSDTEKPSFPPPDATPLVPPVIMDKIEQPDTEVSVAEENIAPDEEEKDQADSLGSETDHSEDWKAEGGMPDEAPEADVSGGGSETPSEKEPDLPEASVDVAPPPVEDSSPLPDFMLQYAEAAEVEDEPADITTEPLRNTQLPLSPNIDDAINVLKEEIKKEEASGLKEMVLRKRMEQWDALPFNISQEDIKAGMAVDNALIAILSQPLAPVSSYWSFFPENLWSSKADPFTALKSFDEAVDVCLRQIVKQLADKVMQESGLLDDADPCTQIIIALSKEQRLAKDHFTKEELVDTLRPFRENAGKWLEAHPQDSALAAVDAELSYFLDMIDLLIECQQERHRATYEEEIVTRSAGLCTEFADASLHKLANQALSKMQPLSDFNLLDVGTQTKKWREEGSRQFALLKAMEPVADYQEKESFSTLIREVRSRSAIGSKPQILQELENALDLDNPLHQWTYMLGLRQIAITDAEFLDVYKSRVAPIKARAKSYLRMTSPVPTTTDGAVAALKIKLKDAETPASALAIYQSRKAAVHALRQTALDIRTDHLRTLISGPKDLVQECALDEVLGAIFSQPISSTTFEWAMSHLKNHLPTAVPKKMQQLQKQMGYVKSDLFSSIESFDEVVSEYIQLLMQKISSKGEEILAIESLSDLHPFGTIFKGLLQHEHLTENDLKAFVKEFDENAEAWLSVSSHAELPVLRDEIKNFEKAIHLLLACQRRHRMTLFTEVDASLKFICSESTHPSLHAFAQKTADQIHHLHELTEKPEGVEGFNLMKTQQEFQAWRDEVYGQQIFLNGLKDIAAHQMSEGCMKLIQEAKERGYTASWPPLKDLEEALDLKNSWLVPMLGRESGDYMLLHQAALWRYQQRIAKPNATLQNTLLTLKSLDKECEGMYKAMNECLALFTAVEGRIEEFFGLDLKLRPSLDWLNNAEAKNWKELKFQKMWHYALGQVPYSSTTHENASVADLTAYLAKVRSDGVLRRQELQQEHLAIKDASTLMDQFSDLENDIRDRVEGAQGEQGLHAEKELERFWKEKKSSLQEFMHKEQLPALVVRMKEVKKETEEKIKELEKIATQPLLKQLAYFQVGTYQHQYLKRHFFNEIQQKIEARQKELEEASIIFIDAGGQAHEAKNLLQEITKTLKQLETHFTVTTFTGQKSLLRDHLEGDQLVKYEVAADQALKKAATLSMRLRSIASEYEKSNEQLSYLIDKKSVDVIDKLESDSERQFWDANEIIELRDEVEKQYKELLRTKATRSSSSWWSLLPGQSPQPQTHLTLLENDTLHIKQWKKELETIITKKRIKLPLVKQIDLVEEKIKFDNKERSVLRKKLLACYEEEAKEKMHKSKEALGAHQRKMGEYLKEGTPIWHELTKTVNERVEKVKHLESAIHQRRWLDPTRIINPPFYHSNFRPSQGWQIFIC